MASKHISRVFDLEAKDLLCNHALTGLAPTTKRCANNYDCGTCPFDQMLDDMAPIQEKRPERPQVTHRAA
jgi:hypothetical protein